MGLSQSRYSDSDYELAIKAAKQLECQLESQFGAEGKGLHEKLNSVATSGELPDWLLKKMRYLATLRNRLVHENGFDRIPSRASFIQAFEESEAAMVKIVSGRGNGKSQSICVIC